MCACIPLFVWQKRQEPHASDVLPPNACIVTSRATPVCPSPGRKFKCGDLYALRGDLPNGVRTTGWRPVLREGEISGKDCCKVEVAPSRTVQVTAGRAQPYKGPGRDFPPALPRGEVPELLDASGWRPRPHRGQRLLGQQGSGAALHRRRKVRSTRPFKSRDRRPSSARWGSVAACFRIKTPPHIGGAARFALA